MTPLFKIGQEVQVNSTYVIEKLLGSGATTKGKVISYYLEGNRLSTSRPVYLVEFLGNTELVAYRIEEKHLQVTNTFNSQAEIWEYLLPPTNGAVVTTKSKNVYSIVNGGLQCIKVVDDIARSDVINFGNYKEFAKYTEPAKWYDNIPKSGILCWVGDCQGDLDNKFMAIIKKHNSGNREPFLDIDGETTWTLAIPVTQEEVNKLIYQQEDTIKVGDYFTVVGSIGILDYSWQGDCLEVVAIDGQFIQAKNHSNRHLTTLIQISTDRFKVRKLSNKYVKVSINNK